MKLKVSLIIILLMCLAKMSHAVPAIYQVNANKFGLNSQTLYEEALTRTGRSSPYLSNKTPWPYSLKICLVDSCNLTFHNNRQQLYQAALTAIQSNQTIYMGPMLVKWADYKKQFNNNLWLITNPSVSLSLYAKRVALESGQTRFYRTLNKKQINKIVGRIAHKYSIDPLLIEAIIKHESAYNQNALSHAGAAGLMQLMPKTGAQYGVPAHNRFNPEMNIRGGVAFLKDLERAYKGNISLMVAAYNAGETAVNKYKPDIPPYLETRQYVSKVLMTYLENLKKTKGS